MSVNQSDLSLSQYGYDFVVATTLEAINATMFQFLKETTFPVISQYYWLDQDNNVSLVPLATLKTTPVAPGSTNPSGTNGIDPSTVPAWDGTGPQPKDFSDLNNSSFQFGFIAQIGIPPGFSLPGAPNPQNLPVLPPMVGFDQASNSVIFNLYCSSFQVFDATWERGIINYNNQSQPSGGAWALQSTIPISSILNNNNLPQAVQKQLDTLGSDAFSVQQLFFDLDQPSKSNLLSITFGGIQPGSAIQTQLSQVFASAYCSGLKGLPALGYTILHTNNNTDPSTLLIGSMELEVCPYIIPTGKPNLPNLGTLNYLCSQGSQLPQINEFTWNWFDGPSPQSDGIIAINRGIFVSYFVNELSNNALVTNNCYNTQVQVLGCGEAGLKPCYTYTLTNGQTPIIETPDGPVILTMSYSSTDWDQAGIAGWIGSMRLSPSYDLTVVFEQNQITINQHMVIYVDIHALTNSASGNIVDITKTDQYDIVIDSSGGLTYQLTSTTTDDSQPLSRENTFFNEFNGLNDIEGAIETYTKNLTTTNLCTIPVSPIQGFVFPGGNTFTYSDVNFSDYQDLVAHINYIDPQ